MVVLRKLSLIAVVFILAAPISAQTLDELLARHVEAKGGEKTLASVESIHAVGTLWLGGMESPYVLEWKRPNKIRRTFELWGREFPQAFDGRRGWSISPHGGDEAHPLTEGELGRLRGSADYLEGELVGHEAKGHTIKLLGSEEINGRPAYKLELTRAEGGRSILYLDAEQYLIVRREAEEVLARGPASIVTTYSDYRRVGGVMMPFRSEALITLESGPASRQTIVLESVTPNVEIADDRFAMPR